MAEPKPKKQEKTESEKLRDFGKFVAGIIGNVEKTIAKGRAKIEAESTKIEPLPDTIAAALGLRSQTGPTAGQSAARKRPNRATVTRRKNGSR